MNCFVTGGGGEKWEEEQPAKLFFFNNLDPVHRIQTKFGMDILRDPWNKPAKEFFIFLKIQDGRRRSKKFAMRYTYGLRTKKPLGRIGPCTSG